MKILILADIHFGKSRESTTHPGITRQSNTEAYNCFVDLIPFFNSNNYDLVVQMGDIIRDLKDEVMDAEIMKMYLSKIKDIKSPVINLLGNHDLRTLNHNTIRDLYNLYQVKPEFSGVIQIDKFQIAWLNLETTTINNYDRANALESDLILFNEKIEPNLPLILFSHYPIIGQNDKGNFYFEGKEEYMHYSNGNEIMNVLSKKNLVLAISAHLHWMGASYVDHRPHITVPSFSEHLLISEESNESPAVYSELIIEGNKLIIKSYSGRFCFFNSETDIK
jgi:DNA repair exonuclease SbcCD nuclease subunit